MSDFFTQTNYKYHNHYLRNGSSHHFQIISSTCGYDGVVYIKGRKQDGTSIGVEVSDFVHYFYVVRQDPFRSDEDCKNFADIVEDFAEQHDSFDTANFYGAKESYEITSRRMNVPKDKNGLFCHTEFIPNKYKEFYGWKPDHIRENVVRLYVNKPYYAKSVYNMLESKQFLEYYAKRLGYRSMFDDEFAKKCMVKTYLSAIDPTFNFRLNAGITSCKWCTIDNYASLDPREANIWADVNISCRVKDLKPDNETAINAPLLRMGYDIECAGKIMENGEPRFPVALWTIHKLQNYAKSELGLIPDGVGSRPELWKRLLTSLDTPEKWISWIRSKLKALPKETLEQMMKLSNRTTLEQFVPRLDDTDPVIIIACPTHVQDKNDKDQLEFETKAVFVFQKPEHPKLEKLALSEYGLDLWGMSKLLCYRFTSEIVMICHFIKYRRKLSPDVLDSWNGKGFDEMYIWDRLLFLITYTNLTVDEQALVEEINCNFGLVKAIPSKCREHFKKTKGGGEFFIRYIDTPLLLQNDGLLVTQHDSYGDRNRKVFTLDAVSMSHLVYSTKHANKLIDNTINTIKSFKRAIIPEESQNNDEDVIITGEERLANRLAFGVQRTMQQTTLHDVMKAKEDFDSKEAGDHYCKETSDKLLMAKEDLTKKLMGFQMRKMQFDIKQGTQMWKTGGKDLWRFIMYCYIDACLPVLLKGKLMLQLALAKATNVDLTEVISKGTQLKTMHLYYAICFHSEECYIIPDKSHHYFHWPGVFDDTERGVWNHLRQNSRTRPNKIPEKSPLKNYMGARVMDPIILGLLLWFIGTSDYSSLYPSIINEYTLCYTLLLNLATIAKYGVKRHEYVEHVLGPDHIITCGETVHDKKLALSKGYENVDKVKVSRFRQSKTSITRKMLLQLTDLRGIAKRNMGAYNRCLESLDEYKCSLSEDEFDENKPIPLDSGIVLNGKCKQMYENGDSFLSIYRTATYFSQLYNEEQLAMKLCGNGTYGATAVNILESLLPLLEIGASVTAIGRHLLLLCKLISQSLTGNILDRYLLAYLDAMHRMERQGKDPRLLEVKDLQEDETSEDEKTHRSLKRKRNVYDTSILQFIPNKMYRKASDSLISSNSVCTIGGDTDSVMNLFPSNLLDDPKTNGKLSCHINIYLAFLINRYQGDISRILHEKTCWRMLVRGKKNYTMICDSLYILKGQKGDTLPFTKMIIMGIEKIYKHITDYDKLYQDLIAIRDLYGDSLEGLSESDANNLIMVKDCLMDDTLKLKEKVMQIKANLRLVRSKFDNRGLFCEQSPISAKILDNIESEDIAMKCVAWVHKCMDDYFRKEVDPFQLTITKKIRKMHYPGRNEAFEVVLKKQNRGEQFSPGSKVIYNYVEKPLENEELHRYYVMFNKRTLDNIRPKNYKGFELSECYYEVVRKNLPIDYWYVYTHKIRDPITSYLLHVLCPLRDTSYVDKETMTTEEMDLALNHQKKQFRIQEMYVKKKLFEAFEEKMLMRYKRKVVNEIKAYQTRVLKQQLLFSNNQSVRLTECSICRSVMSITYALKSKELEAFDDNKQVLSHVCENCLNQSDSLMKTLEDTESSKIRDLEDLIDITCGACLLYSDAPHMDPRDCKSIECITYKQRANLSASIDQVRNKKKTIANVRYPKRIAGKIN